MAPHKVVMPGESGTPVAAGNERFLPSREGKGQVVGAALSEEGPESWMNGEDQSESHTQDPV